VCGRFSQSERVDRIAEIFGAEPDPGLPDGSHNVAPTDPIRIVAVSDGSRRVLGAEWGFAPFWWRHDGARRPGWINARSETALESPAFGPALRSRRCIIPADAFYEWDRSLRPPQPYAIGSTEPGMLALAGLWTGSQRDGLPTAAILTTRPNRVLERLHHRMPVILDADDLGAWLAPESGLEAVIRLLGPAPDSAVRSWPVSTAVNRVGTDGPELLEPVELVPGTLGLDLAQGGP
jgi:putative SOS response-associated peptidase YedK